MSEYTLGYIAVGNIFGIGLSSLFYFLGGRSGKWHRRFISPFILTIQIIISTILLGNFSWWLLLLYPLLMGMFCLGYGGNDPRLRVFKRSLVAALSLFIGYGMAYLYGSWWLLIIQLLVCSGTIMFSVKNPICAASEEVLVSILLTLALPFYPFRI